MNSKSEKFIKQKYRIEEIDFNELTIVHQMPILEPEYRIPSKLIAFSDIGRDKHYNAGVGVHMFLDDVRLECIWNNPQNYIEKLKKYYCVFTPDYSTLMNMNKNIINWNNYKSKHIGKIMQKNGIHVIPSISWAGRNTYDSCFDGFPHNSVVAISTLGVMRKKEALRIFKQGFKEMILRLEPSTIIIYGMVPSLDIDTPQIIHFENTNLVWKNCYQPVLSEEVI